MTSGTTGPGLPTKTHVYLGHFATSLPGSLVKEEETLGGACGVKNLPAGLSSITGVGALSCASEEGLLT